MGKGFVSINRVVLYFILIAGLLVTGPAIALADDTVCARVKIEIKQELTLERQAFDAHMRINNGLANIALEDVKVEVSFADGDGNPVLASSDAANTDALFFIRLDSMENISDVGGTGAVGPSSSADIHWLIIPAPGSSNGLEKGTLYYVGAKLTYTIGGQQKVTEVTPDYIFVKPMPEITLDYFLPADVYGDDPFTSEIEPTIPFSLGVRVKNSGYGVAKKLKIDSAQPKITENEQGLLIGFAIEGSQVNGQPAIDSLLVDFGDIPPNSAGTARWIMTCTLSGKFVSFTADFSHSDELGGELTSLIKAANTHFLVHDVWVDLPGRDAVRDFLAKDGGVYRIYESEVTGLGDPQDQDPRVADQSAAAALGGDGNTRTLTTAVTAGFMYVQLTDPFGGQKVLKEVVRSDGKIIKPANAWLSHTRVKNDPWKYFLNLFDVNSLGKYTFKFEDASVVPAPPVLQYIEDKTVAEGEQASFIVEASDPNGTVPKLSASPLPAGAKFVDENSGRGVFDWTPAEGQAGVYEVIFSASDGVLGATRRATITVKGFNDTDGDNLDDDWEMKHFGTLERDGSGDYDRDGISDLDEFLNETDPAALADLVIRQTADNMNPVVGDPVILTITAINNGPRNTTGVQVTDLLSSGLKYISDDAGGSYDPATGVWNIGDLSAAAPDNTVMVNISVEVIHIGEIINIATLTDADLYDPIGSNNSAGLIINGGIQSDLAIEQALDNPVPDAGDTIAVYIKVTNNGTADATGVQITDVLPDALTYQSSTASQGIYDPDTGVWDVGDLIFGERAELQLKLMVDTTDEIINTTFISGSDQMDPDPTNNRSSLFFNQNLIDHPHVADLAVHKFVNQKAIDVNEQAVFTLVVRNNGPDEAGNIEIDDVLPDGLVFISATPSHGTYDDEDKIWQVANIPAGSFVLMDMTVDVIAGGEQDNSAIIVSLDEFDPDEGNDSAAKSVTGLAADMAVAKSVDRLTANLGQDFVFTITVTNQGPHDAVGVQVVDEVPPGLIYQSDEASRGVFDPGTGQWDIGELANGNSATLQITFRVESSGELINRAVKTASQPTDVNSANDAVAVTVIGNAPPAVGNIPDLTTEEGIGFATIKLDDYVADDNDDVADIIWSYSGSHQLTVHIDDDRFVSIEVPHMDWNGSETITFTATDPFGLSDADEILFTVTAVNDAPVNMVPGGQITAEDTGLVISPSISISDIDANSNALAVTLTAAHGRLTLADRANLAFKIGDGIADAALMFSGTIAAINTALDGMRFDPDANFFGPALLEILTNDQGHTGAGGSRLDVDTINLTITAVNDPPRAALAGPFSGDEGRAVTFSGSASDIDSVELSYHWDFAYNGTFVADVKGVGLTAPQWTYSDNGIYTIALRVEDGDGGTSDIVSGVVTVNNVAPVPDAGTDQTVAEGAPVDFAASFADPGADSHTTTWNFGDGTLISGTLTPVHTYGDNGTYTVTLTVTDDDGGVGTDTLSVAVYNAAPEITGLTSNSPSNGEINLRAAFTDPGWLDSHSSRWEFGDGVAVDVEVAEENEKPDATGTIAAVHNYLSEGLFTASVTVTDDDDADSAPGITEVLIDKTPPVISVFEPQAGYYHNTYEISVAVAVEDPESNGVSSGLVAETVIVTLNGRQIATDEILDLSGFADGLYTLNVAASDYAGNSSEQEVTFEVGPVPVMAAIKPLRWNLSWLNPFEGGAGNRLRNWLADITPVTAYISLENMEAEAILPTFAAAMLPIGRAYGDFVVKQVVVAQAAPRHGPKRIRSVTLQYSGIEEMDVLAFSGDTTWDFYGVNFGDSILLDAGEGQHLSRHTVIAYYQSGPPLYSAANIVPETILLNSRVPIIAGSAQLITQDHSQLGQPRVSAEPPITAVKEGRHHVWLTDLGQPQTITLKVGDRVIFENKSYPLKWHDSFRLEEDGAEQAMGIFASGVSDNLRIFYHNLQAEAQILLDGVPAVTIIPETGLVALKVQFDRFEAISSLSPEDLANGGSWDVTCHGGVRRVNTHWDRHVMLTDLGQPQTVKLVVGDSVIFEGLMFPLTWRDRCFLVDGERQDMSIYTYGGRRRDKFMSVHLGKLTRPARLYFDDTLVLEISPPPEVEVNLTGHLEFDGDPATFDGSFTAADRILLKGRLPDNYDIDKQYQRINSTGSPELQIGDWFGNFEVLDFTAGYDDYRATGLEFSYDGRKAQQINVYGDSRNHLIGTQTVNPGDTFVVDTREIEADRIYLKVGHRQRTVKLTGRWAAETGDTYLDCIVTDLSLVLAGPPHYIDLTLEYGGPADPVHITAYNGHWQAVIDTFDIDPTVDPIFTIDGSGLPKGYLGKNLVLEYGPIEPLE